MLSVVLAGGLCGYQEYVISLTPLVWESVEPIFLETVAETKVPVFVSIWSYPSLSKREFNRVLEYDYQPNFKFRKFVRQHNIKLVSVSRFTERNRIRNEEAIQAFLELLKTQYPESELGEFLPDGFIALPDGRILPHSPEQINDADDAMAAVLSMAKTID